MVKQMKTEELDRTFSALADPTRRAILERLMEGDADVAVLAQPFDMSMPAISKHLKVLERAGLISRGREAQRRPCRIAPDALKDVDAWLESYRALWDERLDRLEVYLREVQAKQKKGKRHGRHDR
jgi:DNA-binding transcriptional ArsR family regulator